MNDNWLKVTLYADLEDGIKHGMLVSNLTYLTAKKLDIDEEECYEYAVAGMLHDIGKLRLSSYLYGRNSNGMLIEEMQYMRMHSQQGCDILTEQGYSANIVQSVLYHHEHYDGSGYPENLKGDRIPLGARILKVADSFAALISERPYREAFDFETAISIMIENIKDYDMKIFLAFMDVIHDDEIVKSLNNKPIIGGFLEEIV